MPPHANACAITPKPAEIGASVTPGTQTVAVLKRAGRHRRGSKPHTPSDAGPLRSPPHTPAPSPAENV